MFDPADFEMLNHNEIAEAVEELDHTATWQRQNGKDDMAIDTQIYADEVRRHFLGN